MSKLATVLKDEISRLGRKDAKTSTTPLKRRVLALEKLAREQRLALKQLAKKVASASRAAIGKGRESQTEFARLTGVTHVAVYLWESGKTRPRGTSRDAIVKARQLGVREARRQLDELPTAGRARRKSRTKRRGNKATRR